MFAMRKFRDSFSFQNAGLGPGVYGTGSTAGNPIAWSEFRKLEWIFQLGSVGSANTQFTVIFATASASNGTFTTQGYLGSNSAGLGFITTAYMFNGSEQSGKVLPVDMRGEWLYKALGAQSVNYVPWVKAFLSASNSSVTGALLALGYLHEFSPASNYDSTSYVAWTQANEQDAY